MDRFFLAAQSTKLIFVWNLVALVVAVGVLLVTGVTPYLDDLAVLLFALALLALTGGAIALLKIAYFKMGVLVGLLGLILLIFSFKPLYGEHVGEPSEPELHRHSIWELGHVH